MTLRIRHSNWELSSIGKHEKQDAHALQTAALAEHIKTNNNSSVGYLYRMSSLVTLRTELGCSGDILPSHATTTTVAAVAVFAVAHFYSRPIMCVHSLHLSIRST